jgi:hypothetical protein
MERTCLVKGVVDLGRRVHQNRQERLRWNGRTFLVEAWTLHGLRKVRLTYCPLCLQFFQGFQFDLSRKCLRVMKDIGMDFKVPK